MKPAQYLKRFGEKMAILLETTTKKNKDYSGDVDAFSNFLMVEHLGISSVEQGILVRMTDKMARASNLILNQDGKAQVNDESIIDTLDDLSVYSQILAIYIENKNKK